MRNKLSFLTMGLALSLAAALAVGTFTAESMAADTTPYNLSPQQPNFVRTDTNSFPLFLSNATATNPPTPLNLTLRQDKGLSLFVSITITNTNASAQTFTTPLYFDVSPDATNNFTTTTPATSVGGPPALAWVPTWTVAASTTNKTLVAWTNFPATFLNNVRMLHLGQMTNAWGSTAGVGISVPWLKYSYSGQ